jgi:hypothetical protein
MKINLRDDWEQTGAKLSYKLYFISLNERAIVDEIFDKMYV